MAWPEIELNFNMKTNTMSKRGTKGYWASVAKYGVPLADRGEMTCEGDSGNGPCGTYRDWGKGFCRKGHKIQFNDELLPEV